MRAPLKATLIAGSLLLGAVGQARASDFYAIIANLTHVKKPHAQIDVGLDTRGATTGTDVQFRVTDTDGQQLGDFTLQVNSRGFVSSSSAAPPNDNLFTLSANLPAALVRVRVANGPTDQYAVLRQILTTSQIALGVPPAFDQSDNPVAVGKLFNVPLGDIPYRATLLFANVSGGDVTVDIFLGTKSCDGCGKYSNPRVQNNALWIVDIDPADAHSNLVISSTGNIIAQLAVDYTKQNKMFTEVTLIPLR